MLNYIKSELFRLRKSVVLRILIGIMSLYVCSLPFFSFQHPADALDVLGDSMIIPYALTIIIALIAIFGEYKNGTIKNSIAFGLNEKKIYMGKIITSIIVGVVMLVFIDILAILSTCLCSGGKAISEIPRLLQASVVCTPAFIASLVFAISAYFICKNEVITVIAWFFFMLEGEIVAVVVEKFVQLSRISYNVLLPLVMTRGYSIKDRIVQPWFVKNGIVNIIVVSVVTIVICIFVTNLKLNKKCSNVE